MAFASNQTSNYGLCQWEETDLVVHTDFNEDNQKIDAALASKASNSTVNALTSRVSDLESTRATVDDLDDVDRMAGRMASGSYTGNGYYGSNGAIEISFSLPIGRSPHIVIVRPMDNSGQGLVMIQGMTSTSCNLAGTIGTGSKITISWPYRGIRWYGPSAAAQMNEQGVKYCWFAAG